MDSKVRRRLDPSLAHHRGRGGRTGREASDRRHTVTRRGRASCTPCRRRLRSIPTQTINSAPRSLRHRTSLRRPIRMRLRILTRTLPFQVRRRRTASEVRQSIRTPLRAMRLPISIIRCGGTRSPTVNLRRASRASLAPSREREKGEEEDLPRTPARSENPLAKTTSHLSTTVRTIRLSSTTAKARRTVSKTCRAIRPRIRSARRVRSRRRR